MEKQYYITKEQFTAMLAAWRSKTEHTAGQHIIYNILRSKPAKLGFAEKQKNIQGNDPWFAFKQALIEAKQICNKSHPWEKYRGNPNYASTVAHADAALAERKQRAMEIFGFDLPDDIHERLNKD